VITADTEISHHRDEQSFKRANYRENSAGESDTWGHEAKDAAGQKLAVVPLNVSPAPNEYLVIPHPIVLLSLLVGTLIRSRTYVALLCLAQDNLERALGSTRHCSSQAIPIKQMIHPA